MLREWEWEVSKANTRIGKKQTLGGGNNWMSKLGLQLSYDFASVSLRWKLDIPVQKANEYRTKKCTSYK
jgi:hypothetical protein